LTAGKKAIVMTLIERDGYVRTVPVSDTSKETLHSIAYQNIDERAHIITDELRVYRGLHRGFASHGVINKSKHGYVRGVLHTNFAESAAGIGAHVGEGEARNRPRFPFMPRAARHARLLFRVTHFCSRNSIARQRRSVASTMVSRGHPPTDGDQAIAGKDHKLGQTASRGASRST
jgi:hypothetical protein